MHAPQSCSNAGVHGLSTSARVKVFLPAPAPDSSLLLLAAGCGELVRALGR